MFMMICFLIKVEDHIIRSKKPKTQQRCKLRRGQWDCNKSKFRKISKIYVNHDHHNFYHHNKERTFLKMAILELDRGFNDPIHFSSPLWYIHEEAYFPKTWAGIDCFNIKLTTHIRFYDHFCPFFWHMYGYLSQNWGSDGHFEVLNGSKSWILKI